MASVKWIWLLDSLPGGKTFERADAGAPDAPVTPDCWDAAGFNCLAGV